MPVLDGSDKRSLQQAAARLADGGLVAFPTETVYGLGARADDDAAVGAIFAAKGRPADHPLIVHVADTEAAGAFATALNGDARALMAAFWPGPVTLIVPRRAGRADAAAGGQASIGLRMPGHPAALALLRACAALGVPGVAAPSANRFGRVSPTTTAHVVQELGPELLVLDGGPCDIGIESAIVDCTRATPALLRPGGIDRRRLEAVLGRVLAAPDDGSPRASGTLEAHYAPNARLQVVGTAALGVAFAEAAPARRLPAGLAVYSRLVPPAAAGVVHRPMPDGATAVAHELFAVLRAFDAGGASLIWVELPPSGPEWEGVRDRLMRAAAG